MDLTAGTFTFSAGLDRTPDFMTTDSAGRQADTLRLLFDTRPHVNADQSAQERLRGEGPGGVQTALWFRTIPQSGMLLLERIQARNDDDPTTGIWGDPIRELPYTLDAANNLEFSVLLTDLAESDSRFSFSMTTYQYGAGGTVAYTQPIPEPETYALMLAGLGLVALGVRRHKRATAGAGAV